MRFTWFLESNKPIGQEYKCRPIYLRNGLHAFDG